MRRLLILATAVCATSAHAQVSIFNSADAAGNAAMRSNWLAAAGIVTPLFLEDFESYAVGTDLNGVPLIGGVTITDQNASPNVTVQSASGFFGSSVPNGKGLALRESRTFVFEFAVPTQYFALLDIDDSGSDVTVILTDNSSTTFSNIDTTAASGASGEFLGFVSTGAAIARIEYAASGGDGEWGLDELEYGAVPEPASLVALGLGAVALVRRRRTRTQ